MKNKKGILLFSAIVIILLSMTGIIISKFYSDYSNENTYTNNYNAKYDEDNNTEEVIKTYDEKIDEKTEEIIKNMTLKEKIGQLFIVEVNSLDSNTNSVVNYSENITSVLEKYNIGGVIYFSDNIVNREQVINLNKELQKNSKTKMFISVDEEGGIVSRIASNSAMGTTKFKSMKSIGDSLNYDKAYEVGNTIGREINELGFNLDFAPDADVLTNPNNSEIGTRSFGDNPEVVAKMSSQVVKGLQENNVSATLKHFPGHGNSGTNSHESYTYTNQTLEEMRNVEFVPFKEGIDSGVDFILVSHIAVPNVTGNKIPSSLNKTVITDILRNELNYNNIVITDALNMKAVSNYYSEDRACIEAINAGNDILLMVQNIDLSYNSILNACGSGEISEDRINESVKRIIKTKLKRNIIFFDENE